VELMGERVQPLACSLICFANFSISSAFLTRGMERTAVASVFSTSVLSSLASSKSFSISFFMDFWFCSSTDLVVELEGFGGPWDCSSPRGCGGGMTGFWAESELGRRQTAPRAERTFRSNWRLESGMDSSGTLERGSLRLAAPIWMLYFPSLRR
jgi:hypothetical protein